MWVAGFSHKHSTGRNELFYLMHVSDEADSQFEMWRDLPRSTRLAKSASASRLGDLYQPDTTSLSTCFDPSTYHPPIKDHVHERNDAWKSDIRFRYPDWPEKNPKLLVGDPDRSFVWRQPKYSYQGPEHHPRCKVYQTLADFAGVLE